MINLRAQNLLSTLGVTFIRDFDASLSPEAAIIELIIEHDIVHNRRMLSLCIVAIENIQNLIRPDLLKSLAIKLSPENLSVLGGIIFRGSLKRPKRWSTLFNYIQSHRSQILNISSEAILKVKECDPFFKNFGVHITGIYPEDRRKLFELDWLLKKNFWLGNRLMCGTSTRSDIITIKGHYLESTPYRVAKRFNISVSSVTEIWNEVKKSLDIGYMVPQLKS